MKEEAERSDHDALSVCTRQAYADNRPSTYYAEKGKGLIDKAYASLKSVSEISSILGISSGYFREEFRLSYGVCPKSYLIQVRVRMAMELLKSKPEKVCDVAVKVGIPHRNTFRRVFKHFAGMTPLEYRETQSTGENDP